MHSLHLQGQKAKRVNPTYHCQVEMWALDIIERSSKNFFFFFPIFLFPILLVDLFHHRPCLLPPASISGDARVCGRANGLLFFVVVCFEIDDSGLRTTYSHYCTALMKHGSSGNHRFNEFGFFCFLSSRQRISGWVLLYKVRNKPYTNLSSRAVFFLSLHPQT